MSVERKKLIKKLDKVFGDFIKDRDKRVCVVCGSRENIQAGHLFSRNAHSTRWDEKNVYAQCRDCNYKHESHPADFTDFFIEKWGYEEYKKLHKKYHTTRKYKDWELEELIIKYGGET